MTAPANKLDTGQVTLTGSAQALVPGAYPYQSKSVKITNKGATNEVAYGQSASVSTADGDIIEPGQSVTFECTDPKTIYLDGTASDVVTYAITRAG